MLLRQIRVACKFFGDLSVFHNQNSVRHTNQLGEFFRNHDDGFSFKLHLVKQLINKLLYTDVNATGRTVEDQDLGIVGDPYVKYGKLFIRCEKEGSAKISISAIAGGSEVAGAEGVGIGGTEFTREISILSRAAGVSENGGWL